jgi:hypothetical protein
VQPDDAGARGAVSGITRWDLVLAVVVSIAVVVFLTLMVDPEPLGPDTGGFCPGPLVCDPAPPP